ncbi:MAG: hypothetical protein NC037_00920 [Bacteroides sp.]|nr:hypothetical protein [Bacillota bacterium]MCM1393762.1 hypothetical protein [[Eubacterium] siraeum]MCM1455081.1 hypothetical protein [Bacteroides sp.]
MKKKAIFISIQILVVAIAIALTATAYAWFVSQTHVSVTPTTVTASNGAFTVIDSEEDVPHPSYMGQTGQGFDGDYPDNPDLNGADAPYVVEKKLTVTFSPLGSDSSMTARLLSVEIARADGVTVSSEGENADPNILNRFTWRVEINGDVFAPDENGFLSREQDGETLYYAVPSSASVDLVFKLVFLDEMSYAHWLSSDYDNVSAFEFSGYEYMRAVFTCKFEVGVAANPAISGESGGDAA